MAVRLVDALNMPGYRAPPIKLGGMPPRHARITYDKELAERIDTGSIQVYKRISRVPRPNAPHITSDYIVRIDNSSTPMAYATRPLFAMSADTKEEADALALVIRHLAHMHFSNQPE